MFQSKWTSVAEELSLRKPGVACEAEAARDHAVVPATDDEDAALGPPSSTAWVTLLERAKMHAVGFMGSSRTAPEDWRPQKRSR